MTPTPPSPMPKVTLDAICDQSLAGVRESRDHMPPLVRHLAGQAAAVIAEQFPDQGVIAGRAVMACAQILAGAAEQMRCSPVADPAAAGGVHAMSDVLGLAAEQVVREATR